MDSEIVRIQEEQEAMIRQDYKDLMFRISRAKQYVNGWRINIDRWRKLYDMEHYDSKRTKEVRYNDPTFTNTVDLSVGIMLGNDLRWHAYGMSATKEEQERTGRIERLIDGTLEINNFREEVHLIYQLFLNFNRDGGGVIYSVYDQEVVDSSTEVIEEPDMNSETGTTERIKIGEVPIRVQIIDPKSVFCLPGGPKKWLLIGREEDKTVLDVETQFGVHIEKYAHLSQEDKATTRGQFQDVWDYVWVTEKDVMVDDLPMPDKRILKVRNTVMFDSIPVLGPRFMDGYKDLPYSIQFFKPIGEDSKKWHSILSPLESSVSMLEKAFNRRAQQVDVYTSLPLVTKTQPGRQVKVDPGLYNTIQLNTDEDISFPQWPGNAPDMQNHMEFLRSRVQQSGFSDVMFGSGQGQSAGYAMSQLGDQNRIRLQQPIKHLELLLTTWAKKMLDLIKYFAPGALICVYGRQRGEDYIEEVSVPELDGFSIRAEIRPNFPNEEMRKVAMATQVKDIISNYTRMEKYLGIEQPEEEEKRKLIEAATSHPISMQYAILGEMEKRAKMGDKTAALVFDLLKQSMQPAGQQGAGANPMQLTGTMSPTGQPPPQAAGGVPPGQAPADMQSKLSNAAPKMGGGMNGQ